MTLQRLARLKISSVNITDPGGALRHYPTQSDVLYLTRFTEEDNPVQISVDPIKARNVAWQLQVIAHNRHCQVVNVGSQEVRLVSGKDPAQLGPGRFITVSYEQIVRVNDFSFTFYRRLLAQSFSIEFDLKQEELQQAHTPAEPLKGSLMLRHTGQAERVQFHLQAEGLPAGACRLNTQHPKFDNAIEQTIGLACYHLTDQPILAGDYLLTIEVKADEYPGQVAKDFQLLRVSPFYRHELIFSGGD